MLVLVGLVLEQRLLCVARLSDEELRNRFACPRVRLQHGGITEHFAGRTTHVLAHMLGDACLTKQVGTARQAQDAVRHNGCFHAKVLAKGANKGKISTFFSATAVGAVAPSIVEPPLAQKDMMSPRIAATPQPRIWF